MVELGRTGMECPGRDTHPVAVSQRDLGRAVPFFVGAITDVAVGVGPPAVDIPSRLAHPIHGAGVVGARADLPPITDSCRRRDVLPWARMVLCGADAQLATRVVAPAHEGYPEVDVMFGARVLRSYRLRPPGTLRHRMRRRYTEHPYDRHLGKQCDSQRGQPSGPVPPAWVSPRDPGHF